MEVDVVDNRVVAVRGVVDDPLFEGYTCIKGRQLPDQMADPDRLRAPLRRRPDGTFEQATSREVLDEIGRELRRIIDTYGPWAVASYTGTGGYQNSVAVPSARAFHQGLGSVSFYTSVTIDQPAKGLAAFRLGGWEGGYQNFTDPTSRWRSVTTRWSDLRPGRRPPGHQPVRRDSATLGAEA